MSKNLYITLPWDKSYTLLVAPVSGRFAVDQNHVGFEINPATTEALGGVIVGDNLVVTDSGRLSAVGEGVAGVSSFNNRVGKVDMTEKDVSDALGFRPTNYKLPVATDSVLGGVKQGKNVTIAADGAISVPDAPTPYSLPVAAKDTLGGIKVGKNLTIESDGTLNAEGGGGTTGVTTFNNRKGDVKLTKKDVTDVVDIPSPYDLPVATEKSLGGVKIGYNLEIKDDGTLNALDQKVEIHPATTQTLGGIIVGDNLEIDAKGRLSAVGGSESGVIAFNGRTGRVTLTADDVEAVQEIASKGSLGVVKVGRNLTIQPDGTLDADDQGAAAGVSSFNGRKGEVTLTADDVNNVVTPYALPIASENGLGGIKVGDNLTIDRNGRLNAQAGGGGQGASHRLIYSEDAPAWTNFNIKKSDINGYISVVTDSDSPAAMVLPVDVFGSEGCQVEINNLNGTVCVYSADVDNIIFNKDDANSIKPYGTAKLIYLGEDLEMDGVKSVVNGTPQKYWLLFGDVSEDGKYSLKKPAIKSALSGDEQITVDLTLPHEDIPVMGYDFEANGSDGSWKHYSFRNDGRNEVVLDGLTNQVEYTITYHTFATCSRSDESDPIKVKPTGRRPDAPTIVSIDGHWNGAKLFFDEPTTKVNITGWVVKDEAGKVYPLESVTGSGAKLHTGFFATTEAREWSIALAAKNENGIGEYTAFSKVYIGAGHFVPNAPKFAADADIKRTFAWTAPTLWGLEDGYTGFKVIAHDLDGKTADVVVSYPKTATGGVTGVLEYDHKYSLTVRAVYPNGETAESKAVAAAMYPHYIKEAPKDVTIDVSKLDSISVTVNDPIKLPCTGFEVWIDGHVVASESASKTCKVTKGYSGGVECLVQVRWIEIDDQFSDLDTGKKVTPAAPAPDVPKLAGALQKIDKLIITYPKNYTGSEAKTYYLMTRNKGDANWRKTDVTKEVLASGTATITPLVNQSSVEVQYCGSAANSSGESMFSDPLSIVCDPYMPASSPDNGVVFSLIDGNLIININPAFFAPNDQHKRFSGIIMKYSVNSGAVQTVVKPVDWKGSTSDWYGANKGDTLHVSFAAQTWGSVEGQFTRVGDYTRP